MRLWLRELVLQALRNARGTCGSHGQPLPLPVPQKIVATWEAISLGRQPVPEYFNFAHDVLDVESAGKGEAHGVLGSNLGIRFHLHKTPLRLEATRHVYILA